MVIGLRTLSFAWMGGTGLGTGGIGGHLIYDSINPIGIRWLLNSGYIFNPPNLTNRWRWDYGCAENIFKKGQKVDNNKVYACKVANLSTWNDEDQIKDKSIDSLIFISEYAIRKGNQGWKIFSILDNSLGPIEHIQLTVYKKENNGWTQNRVLYVANQLRSSPCRPILEKSRKEDLISTIISEYKYLEIRFHNKDWWMGTTGSRAELSKQDKSDHNKTQELSKTWKGIRFESWMWVEGDNGEKLTKSDSSSMFADVKPPNGKGNNTEYMLNSWLGDLFRVSEGYDYYSDRRAVTDIIQSINQVKESSKGKWMDSEEICRFGNERHWNTSEDQLRNLEMFCAK